MLCHSICIFLTIVSITIAGCVSNENSPTALLPNTSIVHVTNTSKPITEVTMNPALSNAPPFITIDPIGNHTVGDVFFINGTTNLPAFNGSLDLDISTANLNPGGWGPTYRSKVSIQPGENGVNTWSCNATVGPGWSVYPPSRTPESISESVSESVGIGQNEVLVDVVSSDTIASQTFFLFPEEPNSTPFITIETI